jgi:competence protein ComEC
VWLRAMLGVSRALAEAPGGHWYVAAPAWGWWLGWYALLLAVAAGWLAEAGGRRRAVLGLAAGWGLAAAVAFGWSERRTRLTVFPDGSGLFVDRPGAAEDLLLDGGRAGNGERLVLPFLHGQGVDRLGTLAVTHGEQRFSGSGPELLAALRPRRAAVPDARQRAPAFRQFLDAVETNAVPLQRAGRGERVAGWEVLHPAAGDDYARAEDNALVLRRDFGGVRVVLLSALGREGQRRLREREADLRADLVIAAVPNAAEPLGDALLGALRPQVLVLANGEFPVSARLKPASRERLAAGAGTLLVTRDTGAVTVTFGEGRAEATTLREPARRFEVIGRPR